MNKKIYISLGLILALTAYIFISKRTGSGGAVKLPELKGLVTGIMISGPKGIFSIVSENGKWFIGADKYPADAAAVNEIEKKIREIEITDNISEGEFYDKYDLTPEKSVEVALIKDRIQVRKIYIGKKGSTQKHTYVRLGDRPGIFLASGVFDLITGKGLNDLRDKDIIKLDPDAVESMNITYKGRQFALKKETIEQKADVQPEKKDDKKNPAEKAPAPQKIVNWYLGADMKNPLSKNKIDQIITVLNPLKAIDFPDTDKASLKNPVCEVKIIENKKEITIKIYDKVKDKNHYPAVSSESPYVFLMDEWKIKKLFVEKIEDLKDK